VAQKEATLDSIKFSKTKNNSFSLDLATSTVYSTEGDRLIRSGKTLKGGKKSDKITITGPGYPSKIYYGGNFSLGKGDDAMTIGGVETSRVQNSRPEGIIDMGDGNDEFRHTERAYYATVSLGKGDDSFYSFDSYGLRLTGGTGRDSVEIVDAQDSVVDLGEGDDIIYWGGSGANSINEGGPGRDIIVINGFESLYRSRTIFKDLTTGTLTLSYSEPYAWDYVVFTGFEQIQGADGQIIASI